jgi:hypothetical protein
MPKINNTQRAAFARLLAQQKQNVGNTSVDTLTINTWSGHDFASDTEPRVVAAIRKHKLIELQRAAKQADKKLDTAAEAAQAELKAINQARRDERKAILQDLTLAIRDVWAADELDDAKALVAKFVKA